MCTFEGVGLKPASVSIAKIMSYEKIDEGKIGIES